MKNPDLFELLQGCETLDYSKSYPRARPGSIFLEDKYARVYWKGYGKGYNNGRINKTLTLRIGDSALRYLWATKKIQNYQCRLIFL